MVRGAHEMNSALSNTTSGRCSTGHVSGGYRDVGWGWVWWPYRCRGALLLLLLMATNRHSPNAWGRHSCRNTTHHCPATATAGSSGGVRLRIRRRRFGRLGRLGRFGRLVLSGQSDSAATAAAVAADTYWPATDKGACCAYCCLPLPAP